MRALWQNCRGSRQYVVGAYGVYSAYLFFRTAQTAEIQQLLSRNFNTVLIVFRLFGQCDNHLPFGAFQLP